MNKVLREIIKETLTLIGELFASISKYTGRTGSNFLYLAQWKLGLPEWFDHRHHLLNPEKFFTDFWTASADNVIRVLPLGGNLLDLCSGDGFYEYWFFRHRASEITCVDYNKDAYRLAVRLHKSSNITYILDDILRYEPKESYYEVVMIRGAIEHFSRENQQIIFKKAWRALKWGGILLVIHLQVNQKQENY